MTELRRRDWCPVVLVGFWEVCDVGASRSITIFAAGLRWEGKVFGFRSAAESVGQWDRAERRRTKSFARWRLDFYGFANLKGNRQLLSTGYGDDRVSLFLMDYPRRERLKILGHARVLDAREHADLADQLSPSPALRGKIERLFLIEAVSYDWNCPQYITPRTEAEIEAHVAPLKARIAELEAQAAGRKG